MEKHVIDPGTIPGWGVDNDPENDPTYPIKRYTGDDHNRIHWERPDLQSAMVEILKSTERPYLSAVFGTKNPPKGLSGLLRRAAYKKSENMNRRWLLLIFSDRIDSLEGIIRDLFRLRFPLFTNDRGWRVLAQFRPLVFWWKILQRILFIALIAWLIYLFDNK